MVMTWRPQSHVAVVSRRSLMIHRVEVTAAPVLQIGPFTRFKTSWAKALYNTRSLDLPRRLPFLKCCWGSMESFRSDRGSGEEPNKFGCFKFRLKRAAIDFENSSSCHETALQSHSLCLPMPVGPGRRKT